MKTKTSRIDKIMSRLRAGIKKHFGICNQTGKGLFFTTPGNPFRIEVRWVAYQDFIIRIYTASGTLKGYFMRDLRYVKRLESVYLYSANRKIAPVWSFDDSNAEQFATSLLADLTDCVVPRTLGNGGQAARCHVCPKQLACLAGLSFDYPEEGQHAGQRKVRRPPH